MGLALSWWQNPNQIRRREPGSQGGDYMEGSY
jgi:hypothetical protein